MAKDTGKKLADMLYGGNPEQAAFGVFPQMKGKRSQQDPQAAKNVPVDLLRGAVSGVLGAPGDIESLIRLLPGLDERTILPTSEEIEGRLPFKSDTPVSRAATGLGQLGGGFYTGPGSPFRLVGAIPSAVKRAGQDFAMAAAESGPKIFIGPKAKTWNQAKADAAARMEKEGVDPGLIWQQTGTFRGADGIWRQEIDDRAAKFIMPDEQKDRVDALKAKAGELKERIKSTPQKDLFPKALTEAKKGVKEEIAALKEEAAARGKNPRTQGLEAKYVFEHPELYKAYPELEGLNVTIEGRGATPGTHGALSIIEKDGNRPGAMEMDIYNRGILGNPTSTTLHEMQHAVQTLEGMAPGGNTRMAWSDPIGKEIYKRRLDELRSPGTFEEFQRANRFPEDKAREAYDEYVRTYKPFINPKLERDVQEQAAIEYYKRLAGEAEARAVQDRQLMTPAQRLESPPPASYDVPQEDLIVKPPREYADGGRVHFSDNPDTMALELAGGGLVKGLAKAIGRAAESAGQKAPVLAEKELTTLQDTHTMLGDKVRAGVMDAQKMMEGFDYKYDKGQRVFTKDSAGKNKPPYIILNRTRVGNQVMREDHPEFGPGMGRPIIDPETGKAMRTPYEPGYRVRMERGPDDWSEFEIPQKAIVGDVEMAAGGGVHMDEGGAAFGQYTSGKKYQAAKKRAEDADVNLLKDPKTYAAVQGLLGVAPDEMGFSVLHPKYQEIKEVADPAFAVGSALQVMPAAKPGALVLAKKGERLAERVVPGIMERGGLPADILSGMAQGSASYAYRPHTPLKPDPEVGTRYKKQYVGGLAPRQDLNIEDLEKSSAKIFPWDATSRNQLITEVSDVPLTKPVLTEGGDEYMMDLQHIKDRIAGASNFEIAKRIKDRIDQAAVENQLLGGTGKVYGFPIRMGERAENFSTFPADIAMDLLRQGGLNKKELKALTEDIRTMTFEGKQAPFRNAAPVGTPEFDIQLREGLEKSKNKKGEELIGFTPGNLRKGLMDRLSKVEYQKRLGYNQPDLAGAVLSDELKGIPKGYVGNVAAELDPFTSLRPSKSSSYSHDFGGQYAGSMPNMPVEFLMPNTFEGMYLEMKAKYPSATPEALRNMAIGAMEKRKEKISEIIGPRTVDAVKTFQEGLMKGEFDPNDIKQVYDYMRRKKMQLKLAAGGEVHGLSSQDMLFLQSQDDIAKLPADAQRERITNMGSQELRQRMASKYAGGGDISADDLILEERKL